MPELPDVEVFRRYLNATSLHQTIERVRVQDKRLLEGISTARLSKELTGRELEQTRRHGKHLLVKTGGPVWLALHFGMTGFLRYFKKTSKQPDHVRLTIEFENGFRLVFDNQRRLGRIALASDPDRFVADNQLGPDALEGIDPDGLRKLVGSSRARVKAALMDQKKLAGIGNVYSDEILFQAEIHPERKSNRLTRQEVGGLYRGMRRVLKTAIDVGADPDRLPRSYLIPRRQEGASCPRCGDAIALISFSGRSAYHCPSCQQRP
jgi:formamidopyrimidine-DNA glycosylase